MVFYLYKEVKLLAKRMRKVNIDKLIKEGRGIGVSKDYKPWIRIQDVPSLGRSSRIRGIKTGRQHELLSDMERNYFYLLEYSNTVKDIREQFPLLPIEDTILIANELGIEHPKHPDTGEFIVMTTDFLVSVAYKDKIIEVARTIKSKDDLLNRRILEKFNIEKEYWKRREVDWGIVTEQEIDKVVASNISLVHGYKEIKTIDSFYEIEENELRDLTYEFIKRLVDNSKTIRSICNEFDHDMFLDKGSGLCIFKYLIINKIVEVDITEKINVNKNMHILRVNQKSIDKVEAI